MSLISYRISYELRATSYEFDFDFRRPVFSSLISYELRATSYEFDSRRPVFSSQLAARSSQLRCPAFNSQLAARSSQLRMLLGDQS